MTAYGQYNGGNANYYGDSIIHINRSPQRPEHEHELHLFPEISSCFHDREEKIKEIHTAVQTCQFEIKSLSKLIVLQASSGMGKSEIARAYAFQYNGYFDYIVWFDAQTETSLKSSFEKLAKKIDIPFKTVADIPEVYEKLSTKYPRGLFIFDSAERLKTEKDKLGIEEYLNSNNFLKRKPICIATSRSGRECWGGLTLNIKLITIDRFSYDETRNCVKTYFRINNQELPRSLDDSICELARRLDGFPLALSLVWEMAAGIEQNISNEEIESKIREFIRNIYSDWDNKLNLKRIFEAPGFSLAKDKNGSVALEVLEIIANLNPGGINLELVYAIYIGKRYDDWFDLLEIEDKDFKIAIDILKRNSLISFVKNKIKIHPLIQQSARKSATARPLTKILKFFEHNHWNRDSAIHMWAVLDELLGRTCVENKKYYLLMLAWKIGLESDFCNLQVPRIKEFVKNGTTDEMVMLELTEIAINLEKDHSNSTLSNIFSTDIQTGLLNLTEEFLSHGWVIDGCVNLLDLLLRSANDRVKKKVSQLSRDAISDWIVQNYVNLLTAGQQVRLDCVLQVLYGFLSTRSVKDDKELFWKWITCTNRQSRDGFMCQIGPLAQYYFIRKDFLLEIFSVFGVDLFTAYLQTGNNCGLPMHYQFLNCLLRIFRSDGASKKFAQSFEFKNSFAKAFEFIEVKTLSYRFHDVVRLWMELFVQDSRIYDTFKKHAEPKFEEICKSTEELGAIELSEKERNQWLSVSTQLKQLGQQPNWLKLVIQSISEEK